jgi:hypothetical protein
LLEKDKYGKSVKAKVSNFPPKKKRKTKNKNFYLSVINFICSEMTTAEKKGYINQYKIKNILVMYFVGFCLFRSRRKSRRSAVSLFFWWLGAKKLPFLSFLFWQLVLLLATLTVHRVPCDSVAHDAELGSVKGSVDR